MGATNIKIGQLQGGKTKKTFKVYWNPDTKRVLVEQPGSGFFGGSSLTDTKSVTSSAEMAMHAAEAYLYNR